MSELAIQFRDCERSWPQHAAQRTFNQGSPPTGTLSRSVRCNADCFLKGEGSAGFLTQSARDAPGIAGTWTMPGRSFQSSMSPSRSLLSSKAPCLQNLTHLLGSETKLSQFPPPPAFYNDPFPWFVLKVKRKRKKASSEPHENSSEHFGPWERKAKTSVFLDFENKLLGLWFLAEWQIKKDLKESQAHPSRGYNEGLWLRWQGLTAGSLGTPMTSQGLPASKKQDFISSVSPVFSHRIFFLETRSPIPPPEMLSFTTALQKIKADPWSTDAPNFMWLVTVLSLWQNPVVPKLRGHFRNAWLLFGLKRVCAGEQQRVKQ